jgi:methionyl-tRNA formyltransferase
MADLTREHGLRLLETVDINEPAALRACEEAEARVHFVIGWSQLVGRNLLKVPNLGTVGIHPTRLPEGRGRAPIPWTLIKGLTRSAVSLLYLMPKADAGDLIDQIEFDVRDDDDAASLYRRIEDLHVEVLMKNVVPILRGEAPRRPQDHDRATYWERRRPEDGVIDWRRPSREVYNWIRGLTHPYPGAFTTLRGRRVFLWKAQPGRDDAPGAPGAVSSGLLVRCGSGSIVISRLQFDGMNEMSADEATASRLIREGDSLGR